MTTVENISTSITTAFEPAPRHGGGDAGTPIHDELKAWFDSLPTRPCAASITDADDDTAITVDDHFATVPVDAPAVDAPAVDGTVDDLGEDKAGTIEALLWVVGFGALIGASPWLVKVVAWVVAA